MRKIIIRVKNGAVVQVYTNISDDVDVDIMDEDLEGCSDDVAQERKEENIRLFKECYNLIRIY